jgi:hypothetical protein
MPLYHVIEFVYIIRRILVARLEADKIEHYFLFLSLANLQDPQPHCLLYSLLQITQIIYFLSDRQKHK